MIFLRTTDGPSVRCPRRRIWVNPPIRRRAFLLGVLLAVGCSAEQASAQGQQLDDGPRSVRGTVVNSVTREPIGRALVSSPDNRFAMLTDSEGFFEFTLPTGRAGLAWLTARKPGFVDDPNQERQAEASSGSPLTISLMPEALISGRAMLSPTDAAVGVAVQLFFRQVVEGVPRWVQGTAVSTASNGEFRFAGLLPGLYKLVTQELMDNDPAATEPGGPLYGFPPVYYPSAADFAAASTIQLSAGQTFHADISLARQSYYSVRIPVANADANPGMNITVSLAGHRGPGYSLGYNPEKHRIEGLLPNGNYLVEVATFGPNSATGAMNIAVAGAPVEEPGMTLRRNSSISLNVVEEFTARDWNGSASYNNGKRTFSLHGPRVYLQVRVEPADDFEQRRGGSLRQPEGPTDNSLVIEDMSPGRYWLRLSSARGYVASATMGGVDLLHQPLVVGSGSSTPIEVRMRDDSAEIEGTVAGIASPTTLGAAYQSASSGLSAYVGPMSSSPQGWVYCVPLPDGQGQFLQLSASSDGKFEYRMVAPGTYRVMAFKSAQPNLPYRDAEAMRAYETKGQVVHLSAGQKANVQLQAIAGSE